MKISNIFNLGVKELRGLIKDPLMVILIVYSFSMAVYFNATAMPETLSKAPIAIVDEDRSPLSGRITSSFMRPYFLEPRMINQNQMDERMDAGLDTFALDIPPDFQRDLLAGRSPTLQLNVDATRMSQAFTGNGYILNILNSEINEFSSGYRDVQALPVDLQLRARFNPELNQGWFGAIMAIIDQITMISIILTGAALIREKEHGTIEHLLVMPISPTEIMLSKVWSMALIVLIASTVSLLFIVEGALGVKINGSIPLFVVSTALHLFATTCMGIFLACAAGTMPQFGMLMMLVLLPLQMLSGGSTPRESMPEVVQWIMYFAPNTHFVMLAQAILFRGAGLSVVWPQLLMLAAIGGSLFAFSLSRFRKFLQQ